MWERPEKVEEEDEKNGQFGSRRTLWDLEETCLPLFKVNKSSINNDQQENESITVAFTHCQMQGNHQLSFPKNR